jgi:DNA-binding LacI/PurR family transcriptional regulator
VLASVSEATVSRVMNGRSGVSDSTRARVLEVLAELGYLPPDLHAGPSVGLVGLIVPELSNPIFPSFAQEFSAALLAAGYMGVLCCTGGATAAGASEADFFALLREHKVDGIVLVSGRNANAAFEDDLRADLATASVPTVFVNGHVPSLEVPTVSSDDRVAARLAVRHLAELGHTRIGLLVGPARYTPVIRKTEGFLEEMALLDLPVDDRQVVETIFSVEGGAVGAHYLIEAGCTGIVAASDLMALGAIRGVRQLGYDVPADVSIIGYDDTELMRFADPPLTTLSQRVEAIAAHATRLLVDQIDGAALPAREYLVRPDLVVRGSTARVAATAATLRSRT